MKSPILQIFLFLIFYNVASAYTNQSLMLLPDLAAADMQNGLSGEPGTVVEFTFDLVNLGDTVAAGDYFINIYLSDDPNLSTDDIKVGDILTGNTGVGTIEDVLAAISIPGNAAFDFYYLILSVDNDDVIAESNEDNNLLVSDFEVVEMVDPPIDESCGFLKNYGEYGSIATFPRPSPIISETANGYLFTQRLSDPSLTSDFVEVSVDLTGELININNYMANGLTPEAIVDNEDSLVNVSYFDETGGEVWSRDVIITSNFEIQAIVKITGEVTEDGVVVVGSYVNDGGPSLFLFFSLIFDFDGNLLHEHSDLESEVFIDFPGIREMYETNAGYVYNVFPGDGTLKFISFSKTGELMWTVTHADDTPSNNPAGQQVSKSGDYLYAAHRNNENALLTKFNALTGAVEYDVNLGMLFTQTGYPPLVTSFNDFAQLEDGGIVAGYRNLNPYNGGMGIYEYGKIDENGAFIWSHGFSSDIGVFRANLETEDGGILFYDESGNPNGPGLLLSLMKVTSTGELMPECDNGPTTSVGRKDILNKMSVFPNPATDMLSITIHDEDWNVESLVLFNALGQLATKADFSIDSDQTQIYVSNLTAGIYYLIVENIEGEQAVEKILIN